MEKCGVLEESVVLYTGRVYDMDCNTVNHHQSRIFYTNDEIGLFIGNSLVVINETTTL